MSVLLGATLITDRPAAGSVSNHVRLYWSANCISMNLLGPIVTAEAIRGGDPLRTTFTVLPDLASCLLIPPYRQNLY